MSTNRNITGSLPEGDEFDWRWVGEPESWMGLRSQRALHATAVTAAEPAAGRLATQLARSFLSLFRG